MATQNKKIDDVVKVLKEPGTNIDLAEFGAELVNEFGGIRGLAQSIRLEFTGAKAGSMMRVHIVELISQVMKTVAASNAGKGRAAEQMSDEDLMQTAKSLLGKVTNAPASAEAEASQRPTREEAWSEPESLVMPDDHLAGE